MAASPAIPPDEFAQFDLATDHSDHHYVKNCKACGAHFTSAASKVHKTIMQEWKLLDKDLPDTIYVRAYEGRIDLLRAAILGAAGTPYHDSLFFFDIAFPIDYPARPPYVHFRSFGFRINPNLYANGKVCLSLLNTWSGKKNERWDPSKSTILQVLLSIQALVLNEKPYFNEPGYGAWTGRSYYEKKAASYNEDVFILCCKTTLCLLRQPPQNFEPLVIWHFKEHANVILHACNAYRYGVLRVGHYRVEASSPISGRFEVSARFKAAVGHVYGDLVAGFAGVGASVANLVKEVEGERERKAKVKTTRRKKHGTKGKSVVGRIKKMIQRLMKKPKLTQIEDGGPMIVAN